MVSDEERQPVRAAQRACAFCGREFPAPASWMRKYCTMVCNRKANAARREIKRRSGGAHAGPSRVDISADDPTPWEDRESATIDISVRDAPAPWEGGEPRAIDIPIADPAPWDEEGAQNR